MIRQKGWAGTITLGILLPLIVCYYLIQRSAGQTGGLFVYFMDDAYIHMGVAKNLLQNGSIGLNEKTWTSLTSSPLYTFSLALLLKLTGGSDQILWPFGMAVWAALVFFMGRGFYRYRYSLTSFQVYVALLALCIPLSITLLSGMEHLLHLFLASLLLLHWQGGSTEKQAGYGSWGLLMLLGALATFTRIETVFLLGMMALLDLVLLRSVRGVVVMAVSVVPLVLFMGWVHQHGASFLPNSMAVKSALHTDSLEHIVEDLLKRSSGKFYMQDRVWQLISALAGLFFGGYVLLQKEKPLAVRMSVRPLIAASGCMLAVFYLGLPDPTDRYDIWINGLFIFSFAIALGNATKDSLAMGALGALPLLIYSYVLHSRLPGIPALRYAFVFLILAYCLWFWKKNRDRIGLDKLAYLSVFMLVISLADVRFFKSAANSYKLGRSIYNQQYLFGQFVKTYYNGKPIVLNDIGTTAFYSESPVIDRIGLATTALMPAGKAFSLGQLDGYGPMVDSVAQARGAALAILYRCWLPDIPKRWVHVGNLNTEHTGFIANDTVSFYAFTEADARIARRNLARFLQTMPATTSRLDTSLAEPRP